MVFCSPLKMIKTKIIFTIVQIVIIIVEFIYNTASTTGGRNNALSTLNLNSSSGRTRTLNAPRNSQYDYHSNNIHRTAAGRSSNNSGGASSKERHRNGDNDFDAVSNASSNEGVRAYNTDMVLFKAQDVNVDNAQNSTSSGDSSTSMLVAEHGFVRFRPMDIKDEKRTKRLDNQQSMPSSASSNSDNNNINKNSPAIVQRHHKRSLT